MWGTFQQNYLSRKNSMCMVTKVVYADWRQIISLQMPL